MTTLFTSPRIQKLRIAKSRFEKEYSYVDFLAETFYNTKGASTLEVIKSADALCSLYKSQGYSDLLSVMKTMELIYVLGAQKAHQEAHDMDFLENISKSLNLMSCSKCGTGHTRKDQVVCPCGNTLYDNKEGELN